MKSVRLDVELRLEDASNEVSTDKTNGYTWRRLVAVVERGVTDSYWRLQRAIIEQMQDHSGTPLVLISSPATWDRRLLSKG